MNRYNRFFCMNFFLIIFIGSSLFFLQNSLLFANIEIDLAQYEKRIYSQNGEDGVIAKIFDEVSPSNKCCVEFGAMDGKSLSNTLALKERGWHRIGFEGSKATLKEHIYQEWLSAENINEIFQKYGIPEDLDFLSIDIDGNDFYIWAALEICKPKVLVIETNPALSAEEDKVILYNPNHKWDQTNYHSCSILSMYKLGVLKDYSLVYLCAGLNAFFVRNDILRKYNLHFKNQNNPKLFYDSAISQQGYGYMHYHKNDPLQRPFVTFSEALKILGIEGDQQ